MKVVIDTKTRNQMSLLISTTRTTETRRAAKRWSAKSVFGAGIAEGDTKKLNRGNR